MTISTRLRALLSAHGGRPVKQGLVAALATALILGTAGGSYAYWTTSASVSSTPRAATLVITAPAVSLTSTYGNDTLTGTTYVTVRNDTTTASTAVPALTIALGRQSGDAGLAASTAIQAWSVASATACSASTPVPTSGVVTGNWNAGVSISGLTLAKTATATICVRSTIADRTSVTSASGSRSFVPVATATMNVSNFTAAVAPTGTQSTQYIFATVVIERQNWYFIKVQGQTNCMDVSGGTVPATSGTTFISYGCKSATDTSSFIWNQQWTFLATDSGYAEIKPRSGSNLRVDTGATTTSSLQLTTAGALGSDQSQQWMVQSVGANLYQFVSRTTGLCMTVQGNAADAAQAACTGATTQRFSLESAKPIILDNVTCAISGTGATRVGTYSFYVNDNGAYTVQARQGTTGAWTTLTTTPATARANTLQFTVGGLGGATFGSTTYNTQVLDSFGTQVDTGTVVVPGTLLGGGWSCT